MNTNGEMILTKCPEHGLAITNTFFNYPDKWYYSWKHLRSKHPTLLDYIITRWCDLKDFHSTRAMRGAECSTDHFMIRAVYNIKPKPRPLRKTGLQPLRNLNVEKLKSQHERDSLTAAINETFPTVQAGNTKEQWNILKNAVHGAATRALGKPSRKHADWFTESNEAITDLINEKNRLSHKMLNDRCTRSTTRKYKSEI